MSENTRFRIILILILSIALPPLVQAGGFQINMLGMKPTSMGGIQTGFGNDVSTVFYNPGAMTFQEFSQISAGAAFSIQSTSYLSPFTGNYNTRQEFYAPIHLYGIGKLNDRSAIGISINTPYHMHSDWETSWPGKYIAIKSNSRAQYFQPTYSYQFSEKFGAGLGAVIGYGRTYLEKALPVASPSGDIIMELDGKSLGFGFNIGLFFKPSDEFTAGLNYRSSVKMKVKEGDATFSNVPGSLSSSYPEGLSFATDYKLPSVISAGAAYQVTRELTICMDVNYTLWNVYDSLSYEFDGAQSLNFGTGRFYKNAFAIRLGAQFKASDKIDVRAGAAFDKSPVPDEYVSPEGPDADRFMFSLGGTFKFNEKFSVDLAYMLQNIKEREAENIETGLAGNFKSLINIFGVTLNYQFVQ